MHAKKFDARKLQKLNNPQRFKTIPPDKIWDMLNIENPDVLIEIGAGTAFFSIAFLKKANPSTVYACDVSDVMLDWVTKHVVPEFPQITPVKTTEQSIPLDDAIGDLVYMINLHHKLDDPMQIHGEAYQMLKPGGKVFIVDWNGRRAPDQDQMFT